MASIAKHASLADQQILILSPSKDGIQSAHFGSSSFDGLRMRMVGDIRLDGFNARGMMAYQRAAACSSSPLASTQLPVVPSSRCSRFQNGARVLR